MMLRVIILMGAFLLSSCIGGGSSTNNINPHPEPSTSNILPLNVSMHDLNGNPIDYIDIYKVGSVYKYKLTFTNPNQFAVTIPYGGLDSDFIPPDSNWLFAHGKGAQPGTDHGLTTGMYYKTNNVDACLNINQLEPGASCSFYTIAFYAFNKTYESEFSYPVKYVIQEVNNPENKLKVEQCRENWDKNNPYDCSNQNKPGFANQFIKYRIVSTPESIVYPTNIIYVIPTNGFSGNGHVASSCDYAYGGPCTIWQVSYNQDTNKLTYMDPKTFNFVPLYHQGAPMPAYDGSSVWVFANSSTNEIAMNSNINPTQIENGVGGAFLMYSKIVIGLDDSLWVNDGNEHPLKSKYNFNTNKFIRIKNAPNMVYGVTRDGTLIAADDNFNLVCATTSDGVNYTTVPMQNFTLPTTFYAYLRGQGDGQFDRVKQLHDQFYGYMDLPVYNALGNQYILWGIYFKIHASRDHCSIDLNQYLLEPYYYKVYDDYATVNGRLTSTNNVAIGFADK